MTLRHEGGFFNTFPGTFSHAGTSRADIECESV